jgi:hypothetical protein
MAGVTLGFLRYVLGLDTLQFRKGMTAAERDLVVMQKRFDKVGQQMTSLGKNLTVGLTLPLAGFAAKGIKEAQETAAAMAQVNASLAAAGNVAGQTAPKLKAAADALELNSLYEGDEILRKVTASLLTFGNVAPQNFQRAQQAIVDYATKSGKDLGAVTVMVGKALNDPLKGMGALSKAGIKLEGDNLKLVQSLLKVGDTAGAQAVVLGLLESRFKNSAKFAQDADPINKMSDAFKQMAESIGTLLLPAIGPMAEALSSVAAAFSALSPETQKFVAVIGLTVAAIGPLLIVLGSVVSAVAKIGPLILALSNAWKALVGVLTLARVVSLALLPTMVPFLVPLAAIATAVGAVYLAWKNWDKITAIVKAVYTGIKTWLVDKFGGIVDSIKDKVDSVTGFFKSMWDKVVGHSYVPDMVDEIGVQMARLDSVMVAPVLGATSKAAEAFRELQSQTKGLLDRLFPESAALNTLRSEIATLEAAMKNGILTAGQYATALNRLQTEGLTDAPIGVLDTGSLVPANDDVVTGIDRALEKMPQVIEMTGQWRDVVGQVAQDLGALGGDWLSAFIEGSAKLKDLWKGILSYAIRALTAQNGPLSMLFGGARAAGGPVDMGKTYLVGEKGPELFSPGRSGRITSNDNLRGLMGGAGGWSGDINVYANDADSFRRSERQIGRDMRRRIGMK